MTDLEITKLCAEAMELNVFLPKNRSSLYEGSELFATRYDPLHDDSQAMALVKKFRISVNSYNAEYQVWPTTTESEVAGKACSFNENLNRAICECVAKMVKSGNAMSEKA